MTRQGALLTPPNNALLRRQGEVLNAAQVLEPRHSGIRLWPISQTHCHRENAWQLHALDHGFASLGRHPRPSPIKVLFQFALKTITALLRLAVLQHRLRLRALFSFLMQIGITFLDGFAHGIVLGAPRQLQVTGRFVKVGFAPAGRRNPCAIREPAYLGIGRHRGAQGLQLGVGIAVIVVGDFGVGYSVWYGDWWRAWPGDGLGERCGRNNTQQQADPPPLRYAAQIQVSHYARCVGLDGVVHGRYKIGA